MVKTDSKPVRKTKLERLIDTRKKRAENSARRFSKAVARSAEAKARAEVAEFRQNFKLLFKKFRSLVPTTFDPYDHNHVTFTYKGQKYSIALDKWHYEGSRTDPDDYDENGTHWSLHLWMGGYAGMGHRIVGEQEVKPGKDYSNEVIRMLEDMEKNPSYYGYGRS